VARIDFDEQIAATVAPVRIEVEKMKQGGQHFARPILLIDRECGHLADRSAAFAVPSISTRYNSSASNPYAESSRNDKVPKHLAGRTTAD
jgi:hypothetical protein